MRFRTVALAAALSAATFTTSGAVVRPKGAEPPMVTPDSQSDDGRARSGAAGGAQVDRPPRTHRTVAWSRASQLAAAGLPGWTAMWDRDTDVPVRLWGPGVSAAGAVGDATIAESAARSFLAQYVRLLAPGAAATDFVVVSNQLAADGETRSVGFQQYAGGVRVLGGTIGISFKHDRLIAAGSTALPGVAIDATPRRLDDARLGAAATGWLAADGHTVRVRAIAPERLIVPVVRPRTGAAPDVTYRLADQVSVEAVGSAGRWDVWLDASTAAPIARHSTILFASGRVLYDVPDRAPTIARADKPAPLANQVVNGTTTLSTADGTVTWASGDATIAPSVSGSLVSVSNQGGSLVNGTVQLADGGEVVWSRAATEFDDAQLASYVFANTAKDVVRTQFNPDLAWLDDNLSVNVNENDTCNAYSTGDDIHFYRAKAGSTSPFDEACENTGRIADVVYHEFGHSLHNNSIIPGVGAFESALSEGLADVFASFITDDHGMGRGFFFSDAPLRDLDPDGIEKRWPDDTTGEPHDDGEIIGETMWDLRKALIAKYGEEQGLALARKLYYGVMQRASDIPTTFVEAMVTDDDDGDLTNGTPNQCELDAVFGVHGLADPALALGLTAPVRDGYHISLTSTPPPSLAACAPVTITSAKVTWKLSGGATQTFDLAVNGTTYAGDIPAQADGSVVEYKVVIETSDGNRLSFPNNVADPMYQMYVGPTQTIWCSDFEDGAQGWTHGASPSNRDDWEVGPPMGLGGDPNAAHGGTNVLGMDLSDDGEYRRNITTSAQSPVIDTSGAFAGRAEPQVRLQYYRWLTVEDGFYDRASIQVNGSRVWQSYASQTEAAGYNHIDREWRFHDIDITAQAKTGSVDLRFELASDPGFDLGGWTIDDVCIVTTIAGPPACPADEPTCNDPADPVSDNGCCSVGGSPQAALGLSLATLGIVLRRRRRR